MATLAAIVDPVVINFLKENSPNKRMAIVQNIMIKYSDRVPVIVGRADVNNTPPISKFKFLAPRDVTFDKFILEVRKNINISAHTALFFFLPNNTLTSPYTFMNVLYEKYKSNDGFLYLTYSCENTFGAN